MATPDLAGIAGLIGDRARGAMLTALLDGRALTATELARSARITKQTASTHLSRLRTARLIAVEAQGRHRYFRLADHRVGTVLEQLIDLAGRCGVQVTVTGPGDPAMRRARVCYDHLAGEFGVLLFDGMVRGRLLVREGGRVRLTEAGARALGRLGIDVAHLKESRRPLCLACLDWSMRRHHLAGAVGAAILERILALRWARRDRLTRAVHFSAVGETEFRRQFGLWG